MTITLDEYRSRKPNKASAESLERTARALDGITREAVRMEALTGNAEWDHFLSYMEAAHKAAIKHREYEFAKLRDPMQVDPQEIQRCKAKIAMVDSRIETLDELMKLPKFIREHGERARDLIAEMTRDAA